MLRSWFHPGCHPELDVLGCEVKWASGSISVNKASGGHGVPAELL